jgi:hypothetical protein
MSKKRALEPQEGRRVRPYLGPDWNTLPTDLVDMVFFRHSRRTMGAVCKRFRTIYFNRYMRIFTVPLDNRIVTQSDLLGVCPEVTQFHPATEVVVSPQMQHISEVALVVLHGLLARHGYRKIPKFDNAALRYYFSRFRPRIPLVLEEKVKIGIDSSYLNVITEVTGVHTLKLIIPSFTRLWHLGSFPVFLGLQKLQLTHKRLQIREPDLKRFHENLVPLLLKLKPQTLELTPQLWKKLSGKYPLPLTNITIKK